MEEYYSELLPPIFDLVPPFRFVRPYEHCYKTRAKGRWFNKKLLDAMEEEFRAYDRAYYEQAILKGKILINKKQVKPEYLIRQGDDIEHYALRTEPPILDLQIKIVHEDDNYLVVDKPPSMIVHTGGGYHYNTLMGVLFFEYAKRGLYTLHRIDRLTSGLLLFSKSHELAKEFHEANSRLTVSKTYFARVQGDFPNDITGSSQPQYCVSMKDAVFACCAPEDSEMLKAKPAQTLFTKIWYDADSDTSLLECVPVTGRTHQIRVHLKDLGHPIINDIGYGGRNLGNRILTLNFKELDFKRVNQRIRQMNNDEPEERDEGDVITKKSKTNDGDDMVTQQKNDIVTQQKDDGSRGFRIYEWDYETHPLEIYLHSFKYSFGDQSFTSEQPYWAERVLPLLPHEQSKQ